MSNFIKYFIITIFISACVTSDVNAKPEKSLSVAAQQKITGTMAISREQLAQSRQVELPATSMAFLKTPSIVIEVQHELAFPKRQTLLAVRSFFSKNGNFIALESVNKISDPRRMQTHYVEKGMRNMRNSIVARKELGDKALLDELWDIIAKRINVKQIREFNINYVEYEFYDGARRPVFIVNIWGPDNPLGMPDELPTVLKNRIRFIYDYQRKTLYADNLL